ncbi:unnamed protein product [Spirodela intermedia]|uniref:CRIB domain-containing protein n=2 Tax=Spirodela intermedia TaxID=51605 RepID=A0A7I8JCT5_SPIIN|nr:unnamed protein product [Spirodela intermedia]CAA6667909.1 unnamed protein product [Spirodela intermedia]CAA7404728.1 unnamed protein product [Spirodela intermedia]
MGERMERLVILPFSIGCVSRTSVDVGSSRQAKKSACRDEGEGGERLAGGKPRAPFTFSAGIQRLMKLIKAFPQLFDSFREEEDEEGKEMEIGFPTDVKHVAHIGPGGGAMGWETFAGGIQPLSALSVQQFELTMAAQAEAPPSRVA